MAHEPRRQAQPMTLRVAAALLEATVRLLEARGYRVIGVGRWHIAVTHAAGIHGFESVPLKPRDLERDRYAHGPTAGPTR
jgi:hypothetical protein